MDKPLCHNFIATDTGEVEDLIKNEGVVGVPNRAASSIVGSEVQTTQDERDSTMPEPSDMPKPLHPTLVQEFLNCSLPLAERF